LRTGTATRHFGHASSVAFIRSNDGRGALSLVMLTSGSVSCLSEPSEDYTRCKEACNVPKPPTGADEVEEIMPQANVPAGMPDWIQNHVRQYLQSGGKEGHMWDSSVVGGPGPLPTLLLTTTGRRSGTKQLVPLIYGNTEGGVVVIASKGGAPEHPGWYRNLVAKPDTEVQVGTDRFRAIATTVEGPERAKLWDLMVKIYPPYVAYQNKTERKIPVVMLRRVA